MSRFIVIEGVDGSGKSTQARLLADRINREVGPCWLTYEPTAGPVGLLIRRLLSGPKTGTTEQELALLFAADRLDHKRAIEEALGQGKIVVCDRYLLSSLAYQGGGESSGWVADLNKHALLPDLAIVLDVPATTAMGRIAGRGEGAVERYETLERLTLLRQDYLRHAGKMTIDHLWTGYHTRVEIIAGGFAPEVVHDNIWHEFAGPLVRTALAKGVAS